MGEPKEKGGSGGVPLEEEELLEVEDESSEEVLSGLEESEDVEEDESESYGSSLGV